MWEDFADAVSKTRLQDEYNKSIRECDIFVMLFCTEVGQYTEEEFKTAFGQFKATNKPFIFTYFKDAQISIGSVNESDLMSLWAFKEKLAGLGHFYTVYKNTEELKLHFNQQLDKLAKNGFIELKWDKGEVAAPHANTYQATLTGNGAIAQGWGATAVGARGVNIGGKNTGNINTPGRRSVARRPPTIRSSRAAHAAAAAWLRRRRGRRSKSGRGCWYQPQSRQRSIILPEQAGGVELHQAPGLARGLELYQTVADGWWTGSPAVWPPVGWRRLHR